MTDIIVELIDADWDSVGSNNSHYNIAAPIALARAIENADTN